MKFTKILMISLVALLFVGCRTDPVYNVTDASVVVGGKSVTLEDVEGAIKRAGVGLGWAMKPVRPGLMEATLFLRTHMAKVEIPYSTSSYSITYKDSVDLDYDGTKIHSNYNGWIQNLDNAIRTQLMNL